MMKKSWKVIAVFLVLGLVGFVVQGAETERLSGKMIPPVSDSDFYDGGSPDSAKVALGKFLFYDKILSGNLNISCATCHHALTDTGDGLSLPVGEGGLGLGGTRNIGLDDDAIHVRVPRNAPPVFNLGARYFTRLFHDGRVEIDSAYPSGVKTPAGEELPSTLDNALAAQAMFPVTSPAEMCGHEGENDLAGYCAEGDVTNIWAGLADRLRDVPEYVALFIDAFPDISEGGHIVFAHAANAIAAFEASAWRADNSPFDRYLRGDKGAMSKAAVRGMKLFYGKAGCVTCHKGAFLTDMEFHAVAMPQIGPGRGDGDGGIEDYGREQVTLDVRDRYKFRTPTLRNVALTGPWGHAGAYDSLEAVVLHFLDPVGALKNYDTTQAVLPPAGKLDLMDFVVMSNPGIVEQIAEANERKPVPLEEGQVADLIEFLQALTDPASIDLRGDIPWSVPSELSLVE